MELYNDYMKLDSISEKIFALVLKIKEMNEGLVSEIWIDEATVKEILEKYAELESQEIINEIKTLLPQEKDTSRKEYLTKLLVSLEFQLSDKETADLPQFYRTTFDYKINEYDDSIVDSAKSKLEKLEKSNNLYRHDVIRELKVKPEELISEFKKYLSIYGDRLPDYLQTKAEFDYEVVEKAPWGAFNYHTAPFASKLTLNAAAGLTSLDMKLLAVHEAYGGHHTELSHKDKLLVEHGRGEHGFVLVYSPQVFISEGIAEAAFEIFGYDQELSEKEQICKTYLELSNMLTNKAVFMYHNNDKSKEDIEAYIDNFDMGSIGKANIANFVTDPDFGKYPAVYNASKKFMLEAYSKAPDKEAFLKQVYTQPCTPQLLLEKYIQS
jgi:hypothetical protein